MHLGDDGRRGDRERESIAVVEACLRAGVVEPHSVDEQVVGYERQSLDGGRMARRVAW